MEYSSPRSVMWLRNIFEHAPVSARTSTCRRSCSGSWASALFSTARWSALFHGEAFPGRRSSARGSPVPCSPWSTKLHIGANPNPRLKVGSAPSLSECAVTSVASMSTITWPPDRAPETPASGLRLVHARARASARACRIAVSAASTSPASVVKTREIVGSEATAPNTSGWDRTAATSARQSPPNATAVATSSSTLPGSCVARAGCHRDSVWDRSRSSPTTLMTSLISSAPEEEISDSRTGSRTRFGTRLRFTYGVPFRWGFLDCRKNKNPKQDRHFRAFSPGVAPPLVKFRG